MQSLQLIGRRTLQGASLAVLIMLAGCGSSGRSFYLAGAPSGASGAAPEGADGDGEASGGTDGDVIVSKGSGGGGGGSGGGSSGGGKGVGGPGGGAIPTEPGGPITGGVDTAGGLLGGVLYSAGNAVLATTETATPTVNTLPAGSTASGILAEAVKTVGQTGQTVGNEGALTNSPTLVVAGQTMLGSTSSGKEGPVGLSVLSTTTTQGAGASAGVLSGGQTASVALGGSTSGAPTTATNGTASSLLGVQAGGTSVIGSGGSSPLIGLNASSSTPAQGTLVTVGALGGGQPATLAVGDVSGSLLGGTSGGSPLGGLGLGGATTPTDAGLLAPVTTTVGGLTSTVTGLASPTTGGGGVLAPLTSVTNTVTSALPALGGATSPGLGGGALAPLAASTGPVTSLLPGLLGPTTPAPASAPAGGLLGGLGFRR